MTTMKFFFYGLAMASLGAVSSAAAAADASAGKEMYLRYCSSCHGASGEGNGPLAAELKSKPADLTVIAKKNSGVFPLDDVMATIDGRRLVKAHGDRQMPVWGEVFTKQQKDKKYTELTTLLKAETIAGYVATLQK